MSVINCDISYNIQDIYYLIKMHVYIILSELVVLLLV